MDILKTGQNWDNPESAPNKIIIAQKYKYLTSDRFYCKFLKSANIIDIQSVMVNAFLSIVNELKLSSLLGLWVLFNFFLLLEQFCELGIWNWEFFDYNVSHVSANRAFDLYI